MLLASVPAASEDYSRTASAWQGEEVRSAVGLSERNTVSRGDMAKSGQVLVARKRGTEQAIARSTAPHAAQVEAVRARVAFADSKKKRPEVLSHQRFASSRTLQEACTERKLGQSELVLPARIRTSPSRR